MKKRPRYSGIRRVTKPILPQHGQDGEVAFEGIVSIKLADE